MVAQTRLNVTLYVHCLLVGCPKNRKTNLFHRNIFSETGQLLILYLENLWKILQITSLSRYLSLSLSLYIYIYIYIFSFCMKLDFSNEQCDKLRLQHAASESGHHHAQSLVTDLHSIHVGGLHHRLCMGHQQTVPLLHVPWWLGALPKFHSNVRLRVLKLTRTEQSLPAFQMTVLAQRADVSTVF